jgi:hypothetical protein
MPPTYWRHTCNPLAGHTPPSANHGVIVPLTTFVLLPVSLGESGKDVIVVDVFFVPVETSNQEAHGPVIVRP